MIQNERINLRSFFTTMGKKIFEILIGTWTLVELIEVPLNGEETIHPMGTKPKGIIIYNNDGYMSVQIMKSDSQKSETKVSTDLLEKQDENESSAYLAYSGPFQTNDEKQTVSHTMFVSLFKNWRGQTQDRKVLFKNGLLHLETEQPFLSNSKLVNHKLTWKRITQSNKNI